MRDKVRVALRSIAAVIGVVLMVGPVRSEEGALVPVDVYKRLDRTTKDLARRKETAVVEGLLEWMVVQGRDADAVADLRADTARALKRAKGKKSPARREAKSLRTAAAELAALLPDRTEDVRRRLAEAVLRLDDTCSEAHEVLGHVRKDGTWTSPERLQVLARRAEIAEALRRARRLPVEVETGESHHPLLQTLYGRPGVYARAQGATLHSVLLPAEKLARILREGLRALAVSKFLFGDGLELPRLKHDGVVIGSARDYLQAVSEAASAGALGSYPESLVRSWGYYIDTRGFGVHKGVNGEAYDEAWILNKLWRADAKDALGNEGLPVLDAGHQNWVCLAFLGARFPVLAWEEEKGERIDESESTDAAREERETMIRVSEAGMAGARSWIAYLAARYEDPSFTACLVRDTGQLQSTPLLKATIVVEYLQETGAFAPLWRATRTARSRQPAEQAEVVGRGLGMRLEELERRWREWLLPPAVGLAQQLEADGEGELDPEVRGLLTHLDALRKSAMGSMAKDAFRPVTIDSSLSEACRAHALYLGENRDQITAWPDAHEEYPDRPGFSPRGSWAGLHSVIAPGVKDPEEALDVWMGTWFHRLPLLEPGLVRIGWALEGRIAVLDAGSMCGRALRQIPVVWPPRDSKDIPCRFVPELPNPFPGEDQSKWGYPVTVQVGAITPIPEITLALYEGSPSPDHLVPTLVTSQKTPGNLDCVPPNAYGLIPKAHLRKNTRYTVVVEGLPDYCESEWVFKTGAR